MLQSFNIIFPDFLSRYSPDHLSDMDMFATLWCVLDPGCGDNKAELSLLVNRIGVVKVCDVIAADLPNDAGALLPVGENALEIPNTSGISPSCLRLRSMAGD